MGWGGVDKESMVVEEGGRVVPLGRLGVEEGWGGQGVHGS